MSKKSEISANGEQSSSERPPKLTRVNGPLAKISKVTGQPHHRTEKLQETQETLEQSISLLNATLEVLDEGIIVVDLAGQMITFNQKFGQMWDMPDALVEDPQQRLDFMADHLKEASQFLQLVAELSPQPEAEGYDIFELKDGRFFECHTRPQWLNRQIVGRVWSFRDISRRKHLELKLHDSLERSKRQVQLSAQVAQAIAALTNEKELYQWVVTQINELFSFYHTQLWHYQHDRDELVLVAGYGRRGQQMLAEGSRIRGGLGLIRLAATTNASILRPDVSDDPRWRSHPLLPETKGEIAVPIKLGKENAQAQVAALKSFIDHNFDGLVVTAIDPAAARATTAKALEKGIPVVSITHDLGEDYQTSLIYTGEHDMGYLLGRQAGEWAAQHIPPGQPLKMGMLNYRLVPQVKQREDGIIEGIKAVFGDNITLVGNETAGDSLQAWPIAMAWLQSQPDLNMIVGYNDATALGAYQAVIAAGKDDPHTFFVGGIDATPEALTAISKGGAYQATVDIQPRAMGIQAVRTVVAALKGRPYRKTNPFKCTPVNLANLDEFLQSGLSEASDATDLAGLDLRGLRIGLSVLNLTNPFFATVVASAKEEADRLGIELVISDPKRVLGVLDVQSSSAGLLDAEDQLVLEGIAAQLAAAIESASLREGLEDHLRELNALQRLTSRESWRAQIMQQQATRGYLYDQSSIRPVTLDELQLPEDGTPSENGDDAIPPAKTPVVLKPMAVHDEIIGGLGVQNDPDKPLTPEDQTFLNTITEQVTGALERARLLEQTQKRAVEMEAVAQVSAIVSTILTADHLLQEVVDLTKERFNLYQAHIFLLNEAGDTLRLAAGSGEVGRQITAQGWNILLNAEKSLVAQAARTRQTIVANDVSRRPNFLPHPRLPEVRAEMAVPMIVGDTVLGVFDVQAEVINHFTDEDVHVQTTLATQIAVALRNASLFQQTQAALTEVQQSQQLLQTVIDAAPDWIFIKDRDYRYRLVNRGYAKRLHRSPAEIIGKNDFELGFAEDRARSFGIDDRDVLESGQPKITESEAALVDDQWVFLSTVKLPVRDAGGNVWGVLGFVRDITQREQLLAETATLYRVAQALTQMDDERAMFEFVLSEYLRMLKLQQGGVLIVDDDDPAYGTLRALMIGGKPVEPGRRVRMVGNPASEKVLKTKKPVAILDALEDPLLEPVREFSLEMGYKSLLLVPIVMYGKVVGILGADSTEMIRHFTDHEIAFVQAMADQLGVVIQNRRLLTETQQALAEVEAIQRRYTIQAWTDYQTRNPVLSHEKVREGVTPLGDKLLPEISRMAQTQTIAQGAAITDPANLLAEISPAAGENDDQLPAAGDHQDNALEGSLIVPLDVRGETIGVLGVQETTQPRRWSPEEIDLVMTIAEQFAQAAETLRLIDETQQRVAREKRVNEIGEKIQAAQSLEEALKIAVREVGLSLQAPQTTVKLELTHE